MNRPETRQLLAELAFRWRAGARSVGRWLADRWTDERSDERFGISSTGARNEPAPASPEFVRYQAVSYRDMREILDRLVITERDVFLDFGAGMGRAVCLAATYSFRSVIGVEISPALCQAARLNVERVAHKLCCRDVRIVIFNAIDYPIPESVSVIFLFNPFSGGVLRNVLANITRSLGDHPRRIHVIFYGTVSSEGFREEAAQNATLRLSSDVTLKTGARALIYTSQAQH